MRTPSGLEVLDELLALVKGAVSNVLEVSGTRYWDANRNSEIYRVGWNPWRWTDLPEGSAPLVHKARDAIGQLAEFAGLASISFPDSGSKLYDLDEKLLSLVDQQSGHSGAAASTIPEVLELLEKLIGDYRDVVCEMPNATGKSERLLVVDTSSLLDAPDLQVWTLDDERWTLVIVPQVLAELDEKKRDPKTRDAARRVINFLEELDRRGDTLKGVPVAGNLSAREIPKSPNMDSTLEWLSADVPDDHIIAGALELFWDDLTSRVAVVASDRNVRNKARLAGLTPIRTEQLVST